VGEVQQTIVEGDTGQSRSVKQVIAGDKVFRLIYCNGEVPGYKSYRLCAEKILGLLTGKYTFPEFEIELEKLLKDLGKGICRIVLQEPDEKIYKDKKERENWRVVQKDCERTITTKFGDVSYKRRYYEDKKTGEKAYLADRAAGIQKYERIDVVLKAEITDLSTMIIKQRFEDLKTVELPKTTLYKAKQRIKNINEKYGNIRDLPILLNKKTFTSMVIKSLLQQINI